MESNNNFMKKQLVKKLILKKETILNSLGGNNTSTGVEASVLFTTKAYCGPTHNQA